METKVNKVEYTTEQLEAMLAKQKEKERKEKEAKRAEYEQEREELVNEMINQARDLNAQLKVFKEASLDAMKAFQLKLEMYGDMRANSKGGFQLTSQDGNRRVQYKFISLSFYDERAAKAEQLLKQFLTDTIKKKDVTVHGIIMDLLEKNKNGQLEFSRINKLYKYEDSYQDPRWKEALDLFKESFQTGESKYDLYYQERDAEGKWQTLNLTFNSL